MNKLHPYDSTPPFHMWGELQEVSDHLILRFTWEGDFLCQAHQNVGRRKVGLWEETCFELFLKSNTGEYKEWNFSPEGHWNCFSFSDYRKKASPWEDQNLEPQSLEFKQDSFQAILPKTSMNKFQISSIVKREKVHFLALSHSSEKPDFHHPDHFQDWNP